MESYLLDWANLLVRWLHLITGIAWIGSSFYFVWLDNHLTAPVRPADRERGVHGELWSVHGGGFYHSQKFLTGQRGEPLTVISTLGDADGLGAFSYQWTRNGVDMHWFKWEAYST